jgi:hypothetical protein
MLKKYKPKAFLGVGCYPEVGEGMKLVSTSGLVAQAVPLLTEGCIATKVDWRRLREIMNAKA